MLRLFLHLKNSQYSVGTQTKYSDMIKPAVDTKTQNLTFSVNFF